MLDDWQIQIRMLDFEDDADNNQEVLFFTVGKISNMFSYSDVNFNIVEGGAISNIFEAKIQDDLDDFFEGVFDDAHSYCVTAINTGLNTPYVWYIDKGNTTFERDCDFIDAYGNNCTLDSVKIIVTGPDEEETIYALPVKKMIENDDGDSRGCGLIYKSPEIFESLYEDIEMDILKYSDCLRNPCVSGYSGEKDGYLLDKNGRPITAVKDFDHSDPDDDGYIYYPVPESDLEDECGDSMLTEEAIKKWKAKLGL